MYYPRALPDRISVRGVEIELLETGAGPTLLYLHAGEGADPDEALVARLAEHFRVVVPAHPGFGLSGLPRHFDSVDDLAYFYLDFLAQRDMRGVTMVGSSIGGWIAAAIAIKDTSRIARLVLDNPLGARFRTRTERDFLDIFHVSPTEWSQYLLAGAPADDRDWASEAEDVALRAARNREAFTRFAWAPYLHDPKLRHRLARIDVPTLLLWGEEDRLASRSYAEAFAGAIPGARLQTIAGAGHFAFHDRPDAIAAAVVAFARPAIAA